MAALPFWGGDEVDEQAWNFVWLGETLLPGIVEDFTVRKGRKLDIKSPRGGDGATLSDDGYEPASIEFSLRIWTAEQWEAFQDALPSIDPQRAGGLRSPLQILHPEAQAAGVTTVYLKEITGSAPSARSGKRYRFSCVQWFPAPKPAKATTTPQTQAPSTATGPALPDTTAATF